MARNAYLIVPVETLFQDPPRSDLHLHTTFTDGRSSVREMLASAQERELDCVAFTEHVRRGVSWFGSFREEVFAESSLFPRLDVLIGIEAKALDRAGGLDADQSLIESADLVLGAIHGFPDGDGGFLPPSKLSQEEAARIEFEASLALLEMAPIDALAHPGALTRKNFGSFPDDYLGELIRKAARVGKAIELNGEYNSAQELRWLFQRCCEAKARITLGSNAHHASEVGRIQQRIKEVAGYEA